MSEPPLSDPCDNGACRDALESASAPPVASYDSLRPSDLPDAFWDEDTRSIRSDQLLDAWRAAEARAADMLPRPSGDDDEEARSRLLSALGRPDGPESYSVESRHPLLEVDTTINAKLHAAGFTQSQAQLVYDLAADNLLPLIGQVAADLRAARELDQLVSDTGGAEAWSRTADQLRRWGTSQLDPDTYSTLSASADGVRAMMQMMRSREPAPIGSADGAGLPIDEAALHEMIRDPRYWRDHDPDFVGRVTRGFSSFYSR